MFQISVARLYDENCDKLQLAWIAGKAGGESQLRRDSSDAPALVGHLNLIHPNRIQVFGAHEAAHLGSFDEAGLEQLLADLFSAQPAAIMFADGTRADPRLVKRAEKAGTPVFVSAMPGAHVIDRLRRYLGKALAETTERHGVFMDVLGLGVLITGDSGAGKSELGLELVSRGHGLVADDVVEISRIALTTLEGRCPPMLKDFLEVRGLGVLNIRTIFGETAVRPKMNLKLVVHLERPAAQPGAENERLPLHKLSEDILGVTVRKMMIPVAAGRNLAVLIEAAVRSYILELRGIHSTAEFVRRQQVEMKQTAPGSKDSGR
jgi:HPr kinase/phosphorylase